MNIAVIGAGAWGSTLADLLSAEEQTVTLWVREPELARIINETGRNAWFLPDLELDPRLTVTSDLVEAARGAECFVLAVPCQFFRAALAQLKPLLPPRPVVVCASKGLELERLETMSQVVEEELEGLDPRYAALSGPSFAVEVARGAPTAVALGCADAALARELQEAFATPVFRVYTNPDFRGVELGGAVKNVIAVAAGVSDGLGYGHNARAALITRGLVEMSRFGEAMGARRETFMGLSGMGDLVLTCTGDLSRNRQVGLELGRGRKLAEILEGKRTVAEGVKTAEALNALARRLGVDMPITEAVYKILYEDMDPRAAVRGLMSRELKGE